MLEHSWSSPTVYVNQVVFFLSFSSYNESSRSCYQRVEKAQHSNTQMPVRVSGSVSQWLGHLLRALPDAFSSSCLIISICEWLWSCKAPRVKPEQEQGKEGYPPIFSLEMLAPLPQFFADTLHSNCTGLQRINTELEFTHWPVRIKNWNSPTDRLGSTALYHVPRWIHGTCEMTQRKETHLLAPV